MILAILAAVYVFLVQWLVGVILWYDELHTYYIAQAPTIARLVDEIQHADLNPPMIYALVRASYGLFGVSIIATRLPSVIAFYLASAAVFIFLARRVGGLWAAAAVSLFWYSPYFRYATEARPYGILLAFFSLTLVSWDSAASGKRRRWALAGIAAGNTGMMLTHVLAPFSIMPFCVAELVRSWRERRIDWAVWAALLLPLTSVLVYIPLMGRVGAATYPPIFEASFEKIALFYGHVFVGVLPAILIVMALAFLVASWRRGASVERHMFKAREAPLLLAALLPPILVNLAMMRSHGPFWDRYCITTVLILYVLMVLFVAYECRLNRLAGLAAAFTLIAIGIGRDVKLLELRARLNASPRITIDHVKPELPFVVNSATTFLAMDRYEDARFLTRVYYLLDRPSALRYAKTDIFEGLGGLKQYFPIRANIIPYKEFVAMHQQFLIFGTADHDGDWVLRKVINEGAKVSEIGDFEAPYEDSRVYEVTLSPRAIRDPN